MSRELQYPTFPSERDLSPERLSPGSRILVVSDGADEDWRTKNGKSPLVGGVKRFSEAIVPRLRALGYEVDFHHPYVLDQAGKRIYRTRGISLYPDLEMVSTNFLEVYWRIRQKLEQERPEAVFITTAEGVLGLATILACATLNEQVAGGKLPYTLAYTTNFDQYLVEYVSNHTRSLIRPVPEALHPLVRFIYQHAAKLLVTTPTMQRRLARMGLEQTVLWPRGVDTDLFRPPQENERAPYEEYKWYRKQPGPILLYFGRVAVEKNLEAFLGLPQSQLDAELGRVSHKVIIGSGPQQKILEKKYADRQTHFLGSMPPSGVAGHLRFADVFVFPSFTDTFGNVILEAGASGLPTVAYQGLSPSGMEIGSQDVIEQGVNGIKIKVGDNLIPAIRAAMQLDRNLIRQSIEAKYSWDSAAQILLSQLKPIKWK